jgi:uncharacterized protein YjbI with pentapeptide repeats
MANLQQLAILKQGVDVWNKWRDEHPDVKVDLSKTDLSDINLVEAFAGLRFPSFHRANLGGASLGKADLSETNLHKADLVGADLSQANLTGADLSEAYLKGADLRSANLMGARLSEADLRGANLSFANLRGASLNEANLSKAHLIESKLVKADLRSADFMLADLMMADLREANLGKTYLRSADLRGADLRLANLTGAILVGTKVDNAKLSGSLVHAVNVGDLDGEFGEQIDLVITPYGEPVISVDDIKVAQFIYLFLNNEKIRNVIHTLVSKTVLILGCFTTPESKTILDALRSKLREYGLLPIVFNVAGAADKEYMKTIQMLAELSYFVIADVTYLKSSAVELSEMIPDYRVPFVPICQEGEQELGMTAELRDKYTWILDTVTYGPVDVLINSLRATIIDPAIEKYNELKLIRARDPRIKSATDFLRP